MSAEEEEGDAAVNPTRPLRIGVIGAGRSYPPWDAWATEVGRGIAKTGASLFILKTQNMNKAQKD